MQSSPSLQTTPRISRNNEPGRIPRKAFSLLFRRLLAIAKYDLLLHVRSFTFWLALIVLIALTSFVTWAMQTSPQGAFSYAHSLTYISASSINVYSFITLFSQLLLPFLLMGTFARDRRRKVHSLLWLRPLPSPDYALGKALAAACISNVVSLVLLLVSFSVMLFLSIQEPPIAVLLMILVATLLSNILVSWFSLLCVSLIPWPLLGALVAATSLFVFNIAVPNTLLEPFHLHIAVATYSPSIGFGPDAPLLYFRMCFITFVALCCLGLTQLLFTLREREGIALRHHLIQPLALSVLSVCVFTALLPTFQNVTRAYNDPGPVPTKPLQATSSHFQVHVTIDPESGAVNGGATLTLTPLGKGSNEAYMMLNPGLRIQGLQVNGLTSTFTTSQGWTRIPLTQISFSTGKPVVLEIQYSGFVQLARGNYAASSLFGSNDISGPSKYLSYVGNGMAFLQGSAGYWYPLPWTQQVLQHDLRPSIDELNVRFPLTTKALSSLGTFSRSGQWQQLNVTPHGSLPTALAVSLAHSQQASLTGSNILYANTVLDREQLPRIEAVSRHLTALTTWLAPESHILQWNVVVVPFLYYRPIVSAGLVFYPERPEVIPPTISRIGAERGIGQEISDAWWSNAFPETLDYAHPLQIFGIPPEKPNLNIRMPYFTSNKLQLMLSQYASARTTDQAFQPGFQIKDERMCRKEYQRSLTGEDSSRGGDPSSPVYVQLGIQYCQDSALLLYTLQQQLGQETMDHFLQQFVRQHFQQPTTIRQFLLAANQASGHDITKNVAPYLCGPDEHPVKPEDAAHVCLSDYTV